MEDTSTRLQVSLLIQDFFHKKIYHFVILALQINNNYPQLKEYVMNIGG